MFCRMLAASLAFNNQRVSTHYQMYPVVQIVVSWEPATTLEYSIILSCRPVYIPRHVQNLSVTTLVLKGFISRFRSYPYAFLLNLMQEYAECRQQAGILSFCIFIITFHHFMKDPHCTSQMVPWCFSQK
jgi:hypothetical protein